MDFKKLYSQGPHHGDLSTHAGLTQFEKGRAQVLKNVHHDMPRLNNYSEFKQIFIQYEKEYAMSRPYPELEQFFQAYDYQLRFKVHIPSIQVHSAYANAFSNHAHYEKSTLPPQAQLLAKYLTPLRQSTLTLKLSQSNIQHLNEVEIWSGEMEFCLAELLKMYHTGLKPSPLTFKDVHSFSQARLFPLCIRIQVKEPLKQITRGHQPKIDKPRFDSDIRSQFSYLKELQKQIFEDQHAKSLMISIHKQRELHSGQIARSNSDKMAVFMTKYREAVDKDAYLQLLRSDGKIRRKEQEIELGGIREVREAIRVLSEKPSVEVLKQLSSSNEFEALIDQYKIATDSHLAIRMKIIFFHFDRKGLVLNWEKKEWMAMAETTLGVVIRAGQYVKWDVQQLRMAVPQKSSKTMAEFMSWYLSSVRQKSQIGLIRLDE